MSIVNYYFRNGVRKFDCNQALKDGWGMDWHNLASLIGLKLQDRSNPKHHAEISDAENMSGLYVVHYKEGGYQALDHAIEEFKPL